MKSARQRTDRAPARAARRSVVGSIVIIAAASCGGEPARDPESAASTETVAPSDFDRALEAARRRRVEVEAVALPAYRGEASADAARSLDSFKRYIREELGAWLDAARDRRETATSAYAKAAGLAPSGDSEVRVIAEAVAMDQRLASTFVETARKSAPPLFRSTPGLLESLTSHAEDAVWGLVEDSLAHCVKRADERAVHTPEAEKCLRDLDAGRKKKAERAAAEPPAPSGAAQASKGPLPPGPTRESPRPAWTNTAHPGPCVFAGSLVPAPAVLHGDPIADRPIASLDSGSEIRVDRLELPDTPAGRYKVEIAYPVRVTAWLDASARPFALPSRVDLVKGHAWIGKGVRQGARRAEPGRAELSLASTKDFQIDPSVAPARLVVACEELRFLHEPPFAKPHENATWCKLPDKGWTPLFDGADGKRAIGSARALVCRELGKAGDLTHLEVDGPEVSLDVWARTSDVGETDGFGMIGIIRHDSGVAYRTAGGRTASVRLDPAADAPSVMTLAPAAEVRVLGEASGSYEVVIPDIAGPKGPSFFIDRASLEPAPP